MYKGIEINKSEEAKAVSLNLPISWKHSTELARFLKNRFTDQAIKDLEGVINQRIAVPYRRNDFDRGHKPGVGPGRYPVKTAKYFLKVLKHAVKNAEEKGLNSEELFIKTIVVSKGNTAWHRGRHRRRLLKRTHIEIVLSERERIKKEKNQKPQKSKRESIKKEKKESDEDKSKSIKKQSSKQDTKEKSNKTQDNKQNKSLDKELKRNDEKLDKNKDNNKEGVKE